MYSENTVYRWIQNGRLPAYELNEQYRFDHAELLEWAAACKVNFFAGLFQEPENGAARDNGRV